MKEFFNFDKKNSKKNLGDERRERRKEGTTEGGNDWNDTTSALFKNLVIRGQAGLESCPYPSTPVPQLRQALVEVQHCGGLWCPGERLGDLHKPAVRPADGVVRGRRMRHRGRPLPL